jgi:threonine aldolase
MTRERKFLYITDKRENDFIADNENYKQELHEDTIVLEGALCINMYGGLLKKQRMSIIEIQENVEKVFETNQTEMANEFYGKIEEEAEGPRIINMHELNKINFAQQQSKEKENRERNEENNQREKLRPRGNQNKKTPRGIPLNQKKKKIRK